MLLAGASPPDPNLPSAQIVSFAFIQSRCRTHTPPPQLPAPLLGAKLQSRCARGFPSRRSRCLLQDPGINYHSTRIAALLFLEPPNLVLVSRSHSAFPRDSPKPAGTWRLPHPPCLPGSSASRGSLNPATSGPAALAVNPFSNRGRGGSSPAGEHSPRTPISAPCPAAQRSRVLLAPAPRALIPGISAGRATPRAGGGGHRPGATEPGIWLGELRARVWEDARLGDQTELAGD